MLGQSKIGARPMLRALGKMLGVEDVKQFPSDIDTSSMKAVFDIANMGFTSRRPIMKQRDNDENIELVLNGSINLVGLDPNFVGVTQPSAEAAFDVRVHGLNWRLEFDAAGALAFNGKSADIYLRLDTRDATTICNLFRWRVDVITGTTRYEFIYTGDIVDNLYEPAVGMPWDGWVPNEWLLNLVIFSNDGVTVFPANTTLGARIAASANVAAGFPVLK